MNGDHRTPGEPSPAAAPLAFVTFSQLVAEVEQAGHAASYFVLHPDAYTWIARINQCRRHWYWRAWWRVRYLPLDLVARCRRHARSAHP